MIDLFKRLWKDESALSATEYGIIAAVLAVGLTTMVVAFRDKVQQLFDHAGEEMISESGISTDGP